MEPSGVPAQKNLKGERLYTMFIPPWRKQSKAVIWCILRIIFVHIVNSVPIRKVIMWFTPYSFPSHLPKKHVLPNLPNQERLVTRVQLVMDVAWLPGAGAQRPQSLMAWDGNWSGVMTLSLGGLLPIPLLLVCLGTGTLTSLSILLQECHAKHEPAHPHLQTLQGVMVNLVQNSC